MSRKPYPPSEFWWAVLCDECGRIPLSRKEFDKQLGGPYDKWRCPKCDSDARFDGDCKKGDDFHEETDTSDGEDSDRA